MTIIAQLTDLHLLEDDHRMRSSAGRARLSFLSFGRPLDAQARRERFARALAEAWSHAPSHILLTGDLTEDGVDAQYEVLAELLAESNIPARAFTLVPGNHDAYQDGAAWQRALEGPLRPYAPTSALGEVIALRDADILPVSTAVHQSIGRSAGSIEASALDRMRDAMESTARSARPLVVAQHHPPCAHPVPFVNWVDGLQNPAALVDLLARFPHAFVVHGHTHRKNDRPLRGEKSVRIFSGEAVVESSSPLRLYEASPRGLLPLVADDASSGVAVAACAAA